MLTDAEVELMETREENRRLEAEVARLRGVVSDLLAEFAKMARQQFAARAGGR
jgi:cell division protein FtsB